MHVKPFRVPKPMTHQQSVKEIYTNVNNSASKKKLRKVSLTRQASAQSLGRKKA